MPNCILYRDVPAEDFLTAYRLHEEKSSVAYLPSDAQLRDVAFSGRQEAGGVAHELAIYLFNQYDMVRDETMAFVVIRTDRSSGKLLENTAKRFRIDLRGQKLESLYRIEPRYGLVVGLARDSVDSSVRLDRDHCYITLVLTQDPSHPEVSLLEYVDSDNRARYREIFQAANQCAPRKRGLMGFDLSKLRSGGLKGEGESPFRHEHVRYFANALRERYGLRELRISLIYKDVTEDDLKRAILDPSFGLFYPTAECRFFHSTEELLA
ncbi:MAG: hypothetical protein JSV08_02730 [Acidobacteriota bacterium]|nr:MAG: hypothetical protein JSV08_02730 [Acidobacteriota bacterium]